MSSSVPVQQNCQQCRRSGYECDLQCPKCSRCTATSTACVYPESHTTFTFVDENNVAAVASRRAARRRSRQGNRGTTIPLDMSLLDKSQESSARQAHSTPFGASILYNLDDRVIQRFISRWAACQTSLGCLDSMPDLLETSGHDSAMEKAILATAYADLATLEHQGDRWTQCYQAYFGSLRRLQDELSNPNFVASDGILAAVLAIDAFELLYMGRNDPLGIHTQAILRLLQLHKTYTTANTQNFARWRSAHQRIYVRQLFHEIQSLPSFELFNFSIENEDRPEVRTIKFVADTCNLIYQLKHERDKPAEQVNGEAVMHLCAKLRSLMQAAQEWFEFSAAVPKARRVLFNIPVDSELRHLFPKPSIIAYDNFWIARDRLLFTICSIKILDTLIELRTQAFLSGHSGPVDMDRTRDFLLATQLDLAAMQAKCRFVLDVVPFVIGLVDSNGLTKVGPWSLNDTGVLTVKSPLNAIGKLNYALPNIKAEANAVVNFLNSHRHVIPQP